MMFFFSPVIWSPNPEIQISQLAVEVNPLAWVLVAAKEAAGDNLEGTNFLPRVAILSCLLVALYALAANQLSSVKDRL